MSVASRLGAQPCADRRSRLEETPVLDLPGAIARGRREGEEQQRQRRASDEGRQTAGHDRPNGRSDGDPVGMGR